PLEAERSRKAAQFGTRRIGGAHEHRDNGFLPRPVPTGGVAAGIAAIEIGADLLAEGLRVDVRDDHLHTAVTAPRMGNVLGRLAGILRPGLLTDAAGREGAVGVVIVVHRDAQLLEIVSALRSAGRLTGLLHRREQKGDQHRDNRDHDQQFNQRKATTEGTKHRASPQQNEKDSEVQQATRRNDAGGKIAKFGSNENCPPITTADEHIYECAGADYKEIRGAGQQAVSLKRSPPSRRAALSTPSPRTAAIRKNPPSSTAEPHFITA